MRTKEFTRKRDENGASLVLAIIFVFAVGLALVAIGGLATSSLRNTSNLQQLRSSEASAETATTVAIRFVQSTSTYPVAMASCLPVASVDSTWVYCMKSSTAPPPGYSRLVDFYTCPSGTPPGSCVVGNSALILHAQVAYSDSNFSGANNCSSTLVSTCGSGIALQSWDVIRADS